MTAQINPDLEALNIQWVEARNGDPCYLGHDPAQLRRAEVLDRHDAEQSGYTRMYRRALAAEAERDELLAEVARLRGMLNAMYDEGHIAA